MMKSLFPYPNRTMFNAPRITTNRILADKVLSNFCGEDCVAWGMGLLEQGIDLKSVAILAGLLPPYNHFEVMGLRDRVLRELEVKDLDIEATLTRCAIELLESALSDDDELILAVYRVGQLGEANNYQENLYDFSLLYSAYAELQRSVVQWDWGGATRENILQIMREEANRFLLDERA